MCRQLIRMDQDCSSSNGLAPSGHSPKFHPLLDRPSSKSFQRCCGRSFERTLMGWKTWHFLRSHGFPGMGTHLYHALRPRGFPAPFVRGDSGKKER